MLAAVFVFMFLEQAAFAHRIDEYLQATLLTLGKNQVQASMRLIPGVLVSDEVIAAIDANGDGLFSDAEERDYAHRVLADLSVSVDGRSVRPRLDSWSFPQPAELRDGLGEIHLEYSVELLASGPDRVLTLENRHLQVRSVYLVNVVAPEDGRTAIVAQKRNERQSSYELDFQQAKPVSTKTWASFRLWLGDVQLSSLFHLGMRHIAEGTDHLLFLLTLLLPAPLLACGARWGAATGVRRSVLHILGIVTAFTVGHSITLTLAALGLVRIPGRPVEVLIAVSIFISAIHALRPIFPGREAFLAGFFGLIHGLAFAATLERLGLARWDRVAGVLAFNVGIEAMQMMVVAAILPSLLLMSRTRAYSVVRIAGGAFAGVASLGWMIERVFNVDLPFNSIVSAIGHQALALASGLFAISLTCWYLLSRRLAREATLWAPFSTRTFTPRQSALARATIGAMEEENRG